MASQQPPLPSWAPEGATWTSKNLDDPILPENSTPKHAGLKLLFFVVIPFVLLLGVAYGVEHWAFGRYKVLKPDALMGMPHVSQGLDATLSGGLNDAAGGRKITVTGYASDPEHIMFVGTNVGMNLRIKSQLNDLRRHERGKTVSTPTDGYGGAGFCSRLPDKTTFCVLANDDSFVLVFENRPQTLVEAAGRAATARRTVLKKKLFRF